MQEVSTVRSAEQMFPVKCTNTVVCEGKQQYIIEGSVPENLVNGNSCFLFTPDRENLALRCILAANTIVSESNGSVPVKVYVAGHENQRLYKGTRLGYLEPYANDSQIDDIKIISCHQSTNRESFISIFNLKERTPQLEDLLWNYRDIFSKSKMDLGRADIKHEIDTGSGQPIALKPRRVPIAAEEEVEKQVRDMLEHGIIKHSTSPWSFPVVVVRKKTGEIRLCVDYRKLNQITKRPIYPIPDTHEVFDTLSGSKYFSTLDLSQGYHQVPMAEKDQCKTAFATKSGQYEYNVMPFGLSGAPATFQRLMQTVLRDEAWDICVVYLDDVLIFANSVEEHNRRLQIIFEKFRQANLRLSPSKCHFLRQEVKYLGHVISEKGVATDPEKISKVINWPEPKCHEELQSFLGLCNYYRRFVQDYSTISNPLWKTVNRKPFVWTTDAKTAFNL